MRGSCRNNYIDKIALKGLVCIALSVLMLAGCGKEDKVTGSGDEALESTKIRGDFDTLKAQNEDIFAWVYVPDTGIDCPVCQSSEGDDSYYINHNYLKQEDPKGAIYTECANLKDMCDFNEVLHGSSPEDGSQFADLQKFLDRKFFDDHEYIHVYLDGNALLYIVFAAFTREDNRLLAEYDFTVASGCQAFLDEIYSKKAMNRNIRSGWEDMVEPENFIITLSTKSKDNPGKQTVVVGCLVGDVAGTIDRYMDYSDPEDE